MSEEWLCAQEKQLKLEHIKLQIERQKLENQIIRDYDKRRQQQEANQVQQSMADLARLLQVLPCSLTFLTLVQCDMLVVASRSVRLALIQSVVGTLTNTVRPPLLHCQAVLG